MLPVFDYCDAVWTPTSVLLTKHLERIHSHFLKGISACSSYVKLTLAQRRRFNTAVQAFKVLHHLSPRYLIKRLVNTNTSSTLSTHYCVIVMSQLCVVTVLLL